jgi:micrococcal nuclease
MPAAVCRRMRGPAAVTAVVLPAVVLLLVLLAVALVAGGCSCALSGGDSNGAIDGTDGTGAPDAGVAVDLLQVIDGDTIRVRMPDGSEERVRYIGIDAPEVAHSDSAGEYLGEEATAHNKELLAAGALRLETDVEERDDYGRLLAYVWAGEVFINERMVRDGYARARNYPPNLARQDELWKAHDQAREAGIGIWSR